MNARKADGPRAGEVIDAICEARERVKFFGLSKGEFLSAEGVRMRSVADSLLMCVLRVTEEAGKLSDEAKAAHPEIDWRGVSGMRNYLAHDYGNVDRRAVWAAIEDDFAVLEKACREIVKGE